MNAELEIIVIPALKDNFVYLLHGGGTTAVVDPSESAPVLRALRERGWSLDLILCTHHHADHTGGNLELVEATGCRVAGAARDRGRIPGISIELSEGDEIAIGPVKARILETPGHTTGAISYFFQRVNENEGAVFTGDTLFSLGCGRLFEGTPEMMWSSLTKLRELPENTRVYFGHEYTQANGTFAVTIEPDNKNLLGYLEQVADRGKRGGFSSPSILKTEKEASPFLRADVAGVAASLGLKGASPVEVFTEIRRRKDVF